MAGGGNVEDRVKLEAAAFLDSGAAARLGLSRGEVGEVAERLLLCVYRDVGKAPQLLESEDLEAVLRHHLPRHFGRRDSLVPHVEPVVGAYLDDLEERVLVPHAFELRQALEAARGTFAAAVAAGGADPSAHPPPRPIVHRADKVGRNDPCPCGSGKKFKKCCFGLGR